MTSSRLLSPAAETLLSRLSGSLRASWVTPAESAPDSWVLVIPVRTRLVATRRVPETAIIELVRAEKVRWTATDEPVPEYLAGVLTREVWFKGRMGRRISLVGQGGSRA